MALSRRSSQRMSGSIWPGFVDAMTALLLVLMFVLTIFMIVQFMLSETITGQESELDELTSEVNALAQALGLEQQRSFSLEERVASLGTTLETVRDRSAEQSNVIAALTGQIETQSNELENRAQTIASFETEVADYQTRVASFEAQVASLMSQRDEARAIGQDLAQNNADLEANKAELLSEREAMQLALAQVRSEVDVQAEQARLAAARRQALDALVAELRTRVETRDANLSDALARLQSRETEITGLNVDLENLSANLTSEQDIAAALRARLADVETQLSDKEIARLADAAAAQALREKLLNADDELTAMTLALEEQRREAEEMLTMIAAARAAEGDLNAQLAAALLDGQNLKQQVADAEVENTAKAARLADIEIALAAALLSGDELGSQLLTNNEEQQQTLSRLAKTQANLALATQSRDALALKLTQAEANNQNISARLASVEEALAKSIAQRDGLQQDFQAQVLDGDRISARLNAVEIALVAMRAERDSLQATLDTTSASAIENAARLIAAQTALAAALEESQSLKSGLTDEADLRKQLAAALAAKLLAEQETASQMSAAEQRQALLATANAALNQEEAKSAESLRRMAVLNEQIAALRGQLGSLQALLEVAEAKDREANVEITNLSSRLNTALARVLAEEKARADLEEAERLRLQAAAKQLENYRSEFFGEIRAILGDREGVKIVGDRFVFSSEVLFEPASADLADDGRTQISSVAELLVEVSNSIPPEIDWVIRVDGHTDSTAMSGTGRYRDNWELSQARALSVVRFMIDELNFPETRLAATGFGEFQPIATGDSPEALAQNRRIELKLTER